MYNRYIQSDRGSYIPVSDDQPSQSAAPSHDNSWSSSEQDKPPKRAGTSLDSLKEIWSSLARRLHLDAGDLLLLAMLYFLYREDADEELLIALGLLLLL